MPPPRAIRTSTRGVARSMTGAGVNFGTTSLDYAGLYSDIGGKDGKGGKSGDSGDHDAWFVARKDLARNLLYVVQGHAHPALLSDELHARDLIWVAGEPPHTHWVYTAKTRYRQADAPCEIESVDTDACRIRFAEAQWAVTPGQSVVVYESRVCLGGGVIV